MDRSSSKQTCSARTWNETHYSLHSSVLLSYRGLRGRNTQAMNKRSLQGKASSKRNIVSSSLCVLWVGVLPICPVPSCTFRNEIPPYLIRLAYLDDTFPFGIIATSRWDSSVTSLFYKLVSCKIWIGLGIEVLLVLNGWILGNNTPSRARELTSALREIVNIKLEFEWKKEEKCGQSRSLDLNLQVIRYHQVLRYP